MTKKKRSVWPWHLLTGLILLVLAWALWFSTSLISYEWRWNRVPQYFAYQAEEPLRANGSAGSRLSRNRAGTRASRCLARAARSRS